MTQAMPADLKGIAASDGLFMGPARRLQQAIAGRKHSGDPEAEKKALAAAITEAIVGLTTLMAEADGEAADILGFQVAMLEDDALAAPAHASIATGAAADAAWSEALAAEIAGYDASDDDYFRARAADLRDLRDRVLRHLAGEGDIQAVSGVVLVGEDLAPTMFLETDWSQGGAIALSAGSATSHVAILARARGVPMVVGLGAKLHDEATTLIVDGSKGRVILEPDESARQAFGRDAAAAASRQEADSRFLFEPARRKDGSRIELLINAAAPEDLDHIDVRCCDGIGLMRSEFLFRDGAPLPDEEAQYRAYRRFVEWAEGRPVTIRTLDIGGDKPITGLTHAGESNPFLGLRGVRLTLARPDVFRTQLRALARAAVHGPLKVMVPMVTVPEELASAAALLDNCVAELAREGCKAKRPPLGIMVEVPAVAIAPELFGGAAFFSIGSNDLTQYVTATSRDDPRVAALNDPTHPAMAKLIASVVSHGRKNGIAVSLCGDMASDPAHLRILLDAGLTSLSVAPARVARIKAALADL